MLNITAACLSAAEEEEFAAIAEKLAIAVSTHLSTKLGFTKEFAAIYAEEINEAAINVLYEITKEVTAMKSLEERLAESMSLPSRFSS